MNKTIKKILKELCPPFCHAKMGDRHFIHAFCMIGEDVYEQYFEFDKDCMVSFLDAYDKAIIWDYEKGKKDTGKRIKYLSRDYL